MKLNLYTILLLGGFVLMLTGKSLKAQVTEVETDLMEITEEEVEEGWNTGGVFSLGFSQVSLTNWAAGGQNSLSGNTLSNLFLTYSKESLSWENTLDVGYGMVRQGEESVIKTNDRIDFMSKLGYKAFDNWHYSGLVNFRTQMTPGYNYPNDSVKISDFLAPAYLLGAAGLDYKASGNLSLFFAPVTGKITIVNDKRLSEEGAFGVEPGETTKREFGGYVRFAYRWKVTDDITFQTKLDLFSNYLDKPQNLDVNWETLTVIKVTQYITINFATHLIYDENVKIGIDTNDDGEFDKFGPRTQFKQLFSVGLSYSF